MNTLDRLKISHPDGDYEIGFSGVMDNIIDPDDTTKPTLPIETVVTETFNKTNTNTEDINYLFENSYIKKILSWKHFNVRAFGEKGHPNLQGFTEDGALAVFMTTDVIDGISQSVIGLPGAKGAASLATSGRMNAVFDDSLWDDMYTYGARYSGVSKLGLEDLTAGQAGGFTGVLDRFSNGKPAARIVVQFMGVLGAGGDSYVKVLSISPAFFHSGVTLDGSTPGLPIVKTGEWFEWDVIVTPNFTGSTEFDMYINGVLIPTKFKYVVTPSFDGPGSCLKIGAWFTAAGGRYSYHANVGVTILQEPDHKVFHNSDLEGSSIYTIITPEGSFNLTCEAAEDITNIAVGHSLQIVAVNQRGTMRFLGKPNFLINGLQSNTIPIWKRMTLEGINITAGDPNYSMEVPLP